MKFFLLLALIILPLHETIKSDEIVASEYFLVKTETVCLNGHVNIVATTDGTLMYTVPALDENRTPRKCSE